MSDSPPALDIVRPLLVPGEAVWAVYPGRRTLVATDRRLFFVVEDRATVRDLDEFASANRVRESLIVLDSAHGGPPVAIEVGVDDEAGLQALTVVGLLVACHAQLQAEAARGPDPASESAAPPPPRAASAAAPAVTPAAGPSGRAPERHWRRALARGLRGPRAPRSPRGASAPSRGRPTVRRAI